LRFDPQRSVYRDCRWCQGRGCLYCESEADKAYKAAFPNGPQPIATFDMTTPEGVAAARAAIGPDALRTAFGPGGGGIAEVLGNIAKGKSEDGRE
jgi:hypothetical protein